MKLPERLPIFAYEFTEEVTGTFAGGTPYSTAESSWPLGREGEPLVFLLQVALEEVSPGMRRHLHLPESGYLQVFHGADDLYGMDLDSEGYDSGACKLLYLPKAEDRPFPRPEASEEDYSPLEEPHRRLYLQGKATEMLPWPDSLEAPKDEDGEPLEAYFDRYDQEDEPLYPFWLGGTPHFVQGEFRQEDSALVLLAGSESKGRELLWGDGGAGGVYLPQADLAKQDYSRALLYWDCG